MSEIQRTFDAVADGYDNPSKRFFRLAADLVPSHLSLSGDEHVLDAATGTGHVALALGRALPRGTVTGIDFSARMLACAEAKLKAAGLGNVQLRQMDMQALDFADATFDRAVSSFGLFFAEDMAATLGGIVRTVKPGGRVLVTSFFKSPFPTLTREFFAHLEEWGTIEPGARPLQRLASPEECAELFRGAGLADVSVTDHDVGYMLESVDQWWDVVWNAGFRRYLLGMAPEELERFRAAHLARIKTMCGGRGPLLEVTALFTSGVKA